MLRPLKVATPPLVAALGVPERVPPPAFVPIASEIVAFVVIALPRESCTVTLMAGVMGDPAFVFEGCTVNANLAAVCVIDCVSADEVLVAKFASPP